MSGLLKSFVAGIREDFGRPISLLRALAAHPQMRIELEPTERSIDANSVPRWHDLGLYPSLDGLRRQRGVLSGWHAVRGQWESFHLHRSEYDQIAHCEVELGWLCDVTDIDGFAASKADLCAFANTDAMAEARCQWLIAEVTPERLAKSLAHNEIRIIHSAGTRDHFTRYLWDGRLWLMNEGGSHHTAAAKYLAARLGQRVPLQGTRYTYSLNTTAVAALRRDFEMFAMNDEDADGADAFFEAMRAFQATWLWHPLPHPYEGARAVLLPREQARSMRVAVELHSAGFADLGAHLATVCSPKCSGRW